jgi:hypothetical protein
MNASSGDLIHKKIDPIIDFFRLDFGACLWLARDLLIPRPAPRE